MGVRLFLQGGDTGIPDVWIVVLIASINYDAGGREHPYGFPMLYHEEAGKAAVRRGMGYTGG